MDTRIRNRSLYMLPDGSAGRRGGVSRVVPKFSGKLCGQIVELDYHQHTSVEEKLGYISVYGLHNGAD